MPPKLRFPDPTIFRELSQGDLITITGSTQPAIKKMTDEGLPFELNLETQKKTFDFKTMLPWIVENGWGKYKHSSVKKAKQNAVKPKGSKDDDDLMDPTLFGDELERYRAAKANLAELDYAKKKGDLIELEKHEAFVQDAAEYCRQAFQSLPKKICVKVAKMNDAGDIEALLEKRWSRSSSNSQK